MFDWYDSATWPTAFSNAAVTAAFLVSPPDIDCAPPVKRFVLLGASLSPVEDGPMMSQISKYLLTLNVEYAILRPTWFMENFSEVQHQPSIHNEDRIVTATGDGRVPFVAASDIAAVGFHALTDEVPHNTDHLILGPELLSYNDVAALLTTKLNRKITHVSISEEEIVSVFSSIGLAPELVKALAAMDTAIKDGAEDRLNDAVLKVTGKKPKTLEEFVDEVVGMGVWEKKE